MVNRAAIRGTGGHWGRRKVGGKYTRQSALQYFCHFLWKTPTQEGELQASRPGKFCFASWRYSMGRVTPPDGSVAKEKWQPECQTEVNQSSAHSAQHGVNKSRRGKHQTSTDFEENVSKWFKKMASHYIWSFWTKPNQTKPLHVVPKLFGLC